LDDLHDSCGIISSSLRSVDHHRLLHCKFSQNLIQPDKFANSSFVQSTAVECICFNRQLDLDGGQRKFYDLLSNSLTMKSNSLFLQMYFFLCVWSQYEIVTELQARHIELLYP
jgi:hypothetical protein